MKVVYKLCTLLLLIGTLSGCVYSHWQVVEPEYYPTSNKKYAPPPYETHNYHYPKYQCHKEAFGEKTCGYDCKKSAFDGWVCATHPEMNCVKDVTDVVCGYNCRKEYTDVKCDKPPPHLKPQYRGPKYQCNKDAFGKEACGYDCKKSAFNGWVCASHPEMNCVKDVTDVVCGYNCRKEFTDVKCDQPPPPHHRPQYRGPEYQCKSDAFGKEACGYDCKETPFDGWICASQPNMNCVKFINEVKCGLNCRREYGDIVCDYPDK
ncbi:hypothetical protein KCM76_06685 [Zooshikella marina]|uniref:hypothetical protein n=1 Tax=Zooshikella ganghwensis TaxID=202772 RepID=UPI001BB0A0DB|nr:hypothetical protein [Zooshikella ganghwensis]MBU2705659.1 hypothetical protein [Zooshikella ganghwensis]